MIDIKKEYFDENEKPLDRLCVNGGFTRIFRRIAVVGDSLSSGEFESLNSDGSHGYHDMMEYSWGQVIGRSCGSEVFNFSRGGMTAIEYCNGFADAFRMWDRAKACQAYIIALGANDAFRLKTGEMGSVEKDVDPDDYHNNNIKTFAGAYATIIQRYKEIQPRAKFFLVTLCSEDYGGDPAPDKDENRVIFRKIIFDLAGKFDNCYVIDLFKYAPVFDGEYRKKFCLLGHLNPMGYVFTGDMICSYIDYIIRHNMDDFKEVGFIGTDLHGEQSK